MKTRFSMMLTLTLSAATAELGQAAEPRLLLIDHNNTIPLSFSLEIGIAPLGSETVAPVFNVNVEPGDTKYILRDKLVPVGGVPGVAKRWGQTGIYVFYPDTTQFWWRIDSGSWNLFLPGYNSTFPAPYNNLTVWDSGGTNGFAAMGNVPAISSYGLIVLALALLVGASLILRSRVVRP